MAATRHVIMSQRRPWAVARFRRLVAVFCAFAFLTVGMAHALNDCDGIGSGSTPVSVKTADVQPVGKTAPAVPCDHCYGCTGALDAPAMAAATIGKVETDFVMTTVAAMRAHGPGLGTPPPKPLT